MKTIFKLKLLLFLVLIGLAFSCKTSSVSGNTTPSESDAIKAGDSTALNTGIKGTTRSNEGNGNESDDVPAKKK